MAPRLCTLLTMLVWLVVGGLAAAAGSERSGVPMGVPSLPHQDAVAPAAPAAGLAGLTGPQGPAGPECSTPRNERGRCITLQSCKPLLDLLKTTRYGPRGLPDADVTLLLRRSHCGFQGRAVMVCCPVDASTSRVKPERSTERPAFPDYGRPAAGAALAESPAGPLQRPQSSRLPPGDVAPEYTGPLTLSGNYPEAGVDALAASTPDQQDDYPTENLALLPIEVCGMSFGQRQAPVGNRSALMQFPWVARLGYRTGAGDRGSNTLEYLCAGSLISERYVLTAAHCVGVHNGPVSVRLGDWDAANDPDCHDTLCAPAALDVAIEEKVVHEGYRRGVSDIALLRLARPVAFSEAVSPICLPIPVHNRAEEESTGKTMIEAGWGNSSPVRRQHAPNRFLLRHRLQVSAPAACHAAYDALEDVHFDADKHLCVGGGCHGDSGSPLMLSESGGDRSEIDGGGGAHERRAVLYGVLSFGLPDCALRSAPVVFTAVTPHVPWLLRHLKPNPFVPKDRTSGSGLVDPRGAPPPPPPPPRAAASPASAYGPRRA